MDHKTSIVRMSLKFIFPSGNIKSKLISAASTFILGLVISSTTCADSSLELEEVIPDTDGQLTQSELRWCIFEPIRLDGENSEIKLSKEGEVENYDTRVEAINKHCWNKRYQPEDETAINGELTFEKRQMLRQAGIARVIDARPSRE